MRKSTILSLSLVMALLAGCAGQKETPPEELEPEVTLDGEFAEIIEEHSVNAPGATTDMPEQSVSSIFLGPGTATLVEVGRSEIGIAYMPSDVVDGPAGVEEPLAEVPDGHALVWAEIEYVGEQPRDLDLVAVVQGERRRLEVPRDLDGSAVVVSVPLEQEPSGEGETAEPITLEDSEVVMEFTTEGVTQQIDLLSGERVTTGIAEVFYEAADYGSPLDVEVAVAQVEGQDSTGTPFTVDLEWTPTRVDLLAWTEDAGWSEGGRGAWLVVDHSSSSSLDTRGRANSVEVSETRVYLTSTSGRNYPAVENEDGRVVYEVEGTPREYRLTSEATVTVFEQGTEALSTVVVLGPVEVVAE